jgi:hypothetical protein
MARRAQSYESPEALHVSRVVVLPDLMAFNGMTPALTPTDFAMPVGGLGYLAT